MGIGRGQNGEENGAARGQGGMRAWFGRQAPYAGFGLLWAWIYCAWFTPAVFNASSTPAVSALDDLSWLVSMGTCGAALLMLALCLPRAKSLGWAAPAGAVGTAIGTALLAAFGSGEATRLAGGVITGACSALVWLAWGRASSRLPDIRRIVPVAAGLTALCVIIALALPRPASSAFVVALSLVSGYLCMQAPHDGVLQGKSPTGVSSLFTTSDEDRREALHALAGLTVASLIACAISAFAQGATFTDAALLPVGILLAMVAVALLSAAPVVSAQSFNYTRPMRYLLCCEALALALLSVGGPLCASAGFVLSVAVCASFDFLLFMFFAVYIQKGFFTCAFAFCTSEALIQIGWAAGSAAAIALGQAMGGAPLPGWSFSLFMCVLFPILIFTVNQQGIIEKVAARRVSDEALGALAARHGLSKRETEVLRMLGQGRSIPYISDALFLAKSTVETHKKHLYAKLDVHTRQELIDLLEESQGR